jgi:signal transduction histidine kinase/CheY-like chemotaxis protein
VSAEADSPVSRSRYERAVKAREEAERLLEVRSRDLYEANEKLRHQAETLENEVRARTARLRQALSNAEEANAARARFLAMMSHEIRTPIGAIIGMLDLLHDEETLSANGISRIEAAIESADSLHRIVNDVLDLSKLDAGRIHFEREPFDVRAIIIGVVDLLAAKAAARHLRFVVDIDPRLPVLLLGDATRLRQVLINLCDNAVKFSDEGEIDVRARIVGNRGISRVRIEIVDQGIGIDPADSDRLFKDFSQLDNSLTRRVGGTGLGLAICKRIVQQADGEIGVESRIGQGSTFWFELPLAEVDPGLAIAASTSVTLSREKLRSALGGRTILLAEDNPINQKLILAYLEDMGARLILANDGREALRLVAAQPLDAILMDVSMPNMDGITATSAIRELEAGRKRVPIIGLTAHTMQSLVEECREVGMDEVVFKPISKDRLARILFDHFAALEETAVCDAEKVAGPANPERGARQSPAAGPTTPLDLLIEPGVLADLRETFDEEQIGVLFDELCAELEMRLDNLRMAFGQHDEAALHREAHAIRGSSSMYGLRAISDAAGTIEDSVPSIGDTLCRESIATIAQAVRRLRETLTG